MPDIISAIRELSAGRRLLLPLLARELLEVARCSFLDAGALPPVLLTESGPVLLKDCAWVLLPAVVTGEKRPLVLPSMPEPKGDGSGKSGSWKSS